MLDFQTPLGAFVALAALAPLLALAAGERARGRARTLLGLPAGSPGRRLDLAAVTAVSLLLALAATQPALRSQSAARVRTDAAALFVVDVSRSMLASPGAGGPSRLAQARTAAVELRAAVPQLPAGIATLTDRVLPDLLPSADAAVFETVLRKSVQIDAPPPLARQPVVTTFEPLGRIAAGGIFPRSARHRVVVFLTDGETEPYDAGAVAAGLGARLLVVQVGGPDDRIYRVDGSIEAAYRPDAAGGAHTRRLAAAAGGRAVGADAVDDAALWLEAAAGSGPTARAGGADRTTPLGGWIALAACVAVLPFALRRLRWLGL
jgi:hypothetical protein